MQRVSKRLIAEVMAEQDRCCCICSAGCLREFVSPVPSRAVPPARSGAEGHCGALPFAGPFPAPQGLARSWAVLMVVWLLTVKLHPKYFPSLFG